MMEQTYLPEHVGLLSAQISNYKDVDVMLISILLVPCAPKPYSQVVMAMVKMALT